ncbi:MAG: right-handed parallel beta-helix repeat-containing protein [Acidobacteriaceae bacterium]|nr:right-handed parallel beta-helix repeat-containing protein [Acidobacteriaceae bacterium]
MKKLLAVCGVAVMAVLPCGGQTAAPSDFASWAKLVSSANNSPVAAEAGDHQVHWTGPDGRKIQLTVKTPRPLVSAPTVTVPSVPEGADARPYFDDALAKAKASKAGRLVIPTGTYVFKTLGRDNASHWIISGLTDMTIDGSGATLVFMFNKTGIFMNKCHRVAVTNLTIAYGLKTASLGTVVAQGAENVLKVDAAYPVTASDTIGHMAEYDPASKRYIPGGMRVYAPPGGKEMPKYIGDQTYSSPAFQTKGLAGKTFVIFHHWYGGTAFLIKEIQGVDASEDIILNAVSIESGPGMGIVAVGIRRGLGIWNCRIAAKEGALVSTEYDAIHVLIVGGDVSIHDNFIANQGDDGINLNNPVHPIVKIGPDGKDLILSTHSRFIQMHDRISAFDETNKYLGTAEVMEPLKPLGGPNNQWNGIMLDHAIEGLTLKSLFRDDNLVNSRVAVVHNTIRDCQCHGLLVQVPNALIADNTFANTSANAIRLLTNLGSFKEGVGAINVLVRNNLITNPGIDAGLHGLHWAAISAYAAGNAGVVAEPSNRFIDLVGNSISNAQQGCISIASSEMVNLTGNICKDTNLSAPFHRQASITISNSKGVVMQDNHRSGIQTGGIDVDAVTTKDIKTQSAY